MICDETVESLTKLPLYVKQFSTCRLLWFTLAEGIKEVNSSPMSMLMDRERFDYLKGNVVSECKKSGLRTNLEYMNFYEPGFFDYKRKGICDALFGRHLAINVKGHVMPCCLYWGEHLDNLVDLPFGKVWNGEKTRVWRRKMLKEEYSHMCSNFCGYA